VHHDRHAGDEFLNLFNDFEVEALLAFEFVGAVTSADGCGQRIAPAAFHEFHRFLRVRERCMSLVDCDVLLHSSKLPELRLDADAFGMRAIDDPFRDRDVIFE
jgi:hypothetical protein